MAIGRITPSWGFNDYTTVKPTPVPKFKPTAGMFEFFFGPTMVPRFGAHTYNNQDSPTKTNPNTEQNTTKTEDTTVISTNSNSTTDNITQSQQSTKTNEISTNITNSANLNANNTNLDLEPTPEPEIRYIDKSDTAVQSSNIDASNDTNVVPKTDSENVPASKSNTKIITDNSTILREVETQKITNHSTIQTKTTKPEERLTPNISEQPTSDVTLSMSGSLDAHTTKLTPAPSHVSPTSGWFGWQFPNVKQGSYVIYADQQKENDKKKAEPVPKYIKDTTTGSYIILADTQKENDQKKTASVAINPVNESTINTNDKTNITATSVSKTELLPSNTTQINGTTGSVEIKTLIDVKYTTAVPVIDHTLSVSGITDKPTTLLEQEVFISAMKITVPDTLKLSNLSNSVTNSTTKISGPISDNEHAIGTAAGIATEKPQVFQTQSIWDFGFNDATTAANPVELTHHTTAGMFDYLYSPTEAPNTNAMNQGSFDLTQRINEASTITTPELEIYTTKANTTVSNDTAKTISETVIPNPHEFTIKKETTGITQKPMSTTTVSVHELTTSTVSPVNKTTEKITSEPNVATTLEAETVLTEVNTTEKMPAESPGAIVQEDLNATRATVDVKPNEGNTTEQNKIVTKSVETTTHAKIEQEGKHQPEINVSVFTNETMDSSKAEVNWTTVVKDPSNVKTYHGINQPGIKLNDTGVILLVGSLSSPPKDPNAPDTNIKSEVQHAPGAPEAVPEAIPEIQTESGMHSFTSNPSIFADDRLQTVLPGNQASPSRSQFSDIPAQHQDHPTGPAFYPTQRPGNVIRGQLKEGWINGYIFQRLFYQ